MGEPVDARDEDQRWRDFGLYLEGLRTERGLTRTQVAEQTGMSRVGLVSLEQGGRRDRGKWVIPNPKDEQLAKLARLYGVPVEKFYEQVGRFATRPRTKASRRGIAFQPGREEEEDIRTLLTRVEERLARIERRMGEGENDEQPPARRRRGRAG
jgi:transcriptional regulator with XRE-family HTH domain